MKALRFHGRGDVRLDDIAEPTPAHGQIKIAIESAGICGSDVHEYKGGPISVPTTSPHPQTGECAPVVFGHEFSGIVTEVGDGVERIRVGQRVAANAALWCGQCPPCRSGLTNVCTTIGFHGVSGGGGAFAAFDVIDGRSAHVLPASMSADVGALLEPLATAIHAVDLAGLRPGDSALVIGAGPVGLMAVSACTAIPLSAIIVVEPSESRRRLAEQFGATTVIDPFATDVVAAVTELTGGQGVDGSFDAAAAPQSLTTAIASTRARGTIVNIAAWEKGFEFDPTTLLHRENIVRGSLAYTSADFDAAIEHAISRTAIMESMITSRVHLSEIVPRGFDRLAYERHNEVKILVHP